MQAAGDARYIKEKLCERLQTEIFLDSDDLRDLRTLLTSVAQTDVLLILLTKDYLTRPYCLLEIHAAITHGIPMVAVHVVGGAFEYRFDHAQVFLANFEQALHSCNPAAIEVLRQQGAEPSALGATLRDHIPNIIAKTFQPSASANVLSAQIDDIIEAMEDAKTHKHN